MAIILLCTLLVILYLFMIMPRVFDRPDMAPFQGWLYAHRGLHDNDSDAPENSLNAFQKAVNKGFGIELDVQLSKDGIPVVFHDYTLERICGEEGKICDFSYDELQQFTLCSSDQHIPGFEEVLKLVDSKVPLIVELKFESLDTSVCQAADKLLSNYRGLYCVESFNPLGVWWYRKHRKGVVRGQLSDAFLKEGRYRGPLYFLLGNLLLNWIGKPDFIAYNHRYPNCLSRRLCRSFYHNTSVAWTVRTPQELKEARKYFDIYIFDSFVPEGEK